MYIVVISSRHFVFSISTNPLKKSGEKNTSVFCFFDIGYVCVCVCVYSVCLYMYTETRVETCAKCCMLNEPVTLLDNRNWSKLIWQWLSSSVSFRLSRTNFLPQVSEKKRRRKRRRRPSPSSSADQCIYVYIHTWIWTTDRWSLFSNHIH